MNARSDVDSTITVLEAVRQSLLNMTRYDPATVAPPAAVLWTDEESQWQALVLRLRALMPELLTLGDYNPVEKTGPAIWLRCVVDHGLPEMGLPEGAVPVIYMPHVSRYMLRMAEKCPHWLEPLVELQYRGVVWTQRNGRDWTVEAFLVSEDGLALDVAKDRQTREAMLRALAELAITPVSRLRGKRLEADDFDRLIVADADRDLLVWINDPSQVAVQWGQEKWQAFRSRCRAEYGFDPEEEGQLIAARSLGLRQTERWRSLWQRFEESPAIYPNIPRVLEQVKLGEIAFDREPWPDENARDEKDLRSALLSLERLSPREARVRIDELERQHGLRRRWVWAKLGQSPLAQALEYLSVLARKTAVSLGSASLDELADRYVQEAYTVDDAVLRVLSIPRSTDDRRAVDAAVRSIYLPWLDEITTRFQELVSKSPLPTCASSQTGISAKEKECLLFVDGLRYDVAMRLSSLAVQRGFLVNASRRWAAVPTVTATAKPAVSPIADRLRAEELSPDFYPMSSENGQSLTVDRFRKLLREAGYQVFDPSENGEPNMSGARGWTECGQFDRLGHSLQSRLAAQVDEEVGRIMERIDDLLEAGWTQVRVITDHGWLLMPGGFPVMKLPKYLTQSRWPRCAAVRQEAAVEVPTFPWYWNPSQYVAVAPSVHCFVQGDEYVHGGLSLQECLVPELTFCRGYDPNRTRITAVIKDVQWVGLRCRVAVSSSSEDVVVDLRTKPGDPSSSLVEPRAIDDHGRASVLVDDDSLEGMSVTVVLLDSAGNIIDRQPTIVGG